MTELGVPSYTLDASYRRHDRVIIGGSPLRLFRLSASGVRVMEAIESGAPPPAGHGKLTDRLVEAGAIHPHPHRGPYTVDDVTIVVPAFVAQPSNTISGPHVIVVDDGSDPPLPHLEAARTIRLETNRGPAAARNAGLARVATALVAFVDTDVDVDDGWLEPLLAHFNDPLVALVAPRVASTTGAEPTARYDESRSPLDLGSVEARIAPGTRVSYVPAAAIVARADALRAVGGFDEALRTGEDVDVVWRLVAAGHRCRYEPSAVVRHHPRRTLSSWCRQRFAYGRSAAPLDRAHPGAVAPLRISGWTVGVWALLALRRPVAALAVVAGTIAALRRNLADLPPHESMRFAGLGHLYAGRQIATAIVRVWWPIALAAAVFSKRARRVLLLSALVPTALDWRADHPSLDPARYAALHVLDDVSYGAGVWAGSIRERRAGALLPEIRSWPGRAAG